MIANKINDIQNLAIMQKFNFSQETIKAIADHILGTEIEGRITTVEDAEFEQDGFLIMIDYEVYANWRDKQMVHSEFSYNNVEDLSGWEMAGASILGVNVYGDDGEDVAYDESDIKTIEKKVAA